MTATELAREFPAAFRERAVLTLIMSAIALTAPRVAAAQYPQQPITLLVGYDAGSVGDQIARGLAEAAKKHLGQSMIVVNRSGASGTLAISEAIAATADGYTLGLGTIGNLTIQPQRMALSYGAPDTYVPVAELISYPNVLMVRAGFRWKTVREFLDYARAADVTVGVPGIATVAHLNIEQLGRAARLRLTAVPFVGPQQVDAALRGDIDAAVAGPGPIMPLVESGKALILGVFDDKRLPLSPKCAHVQRDGIRCHTAQCTSDRRATGHSCFDRRCAGRRN